MRPITADGWFRTGDLGYTTSDRAFVLITRSGRCHSIIRLHGQPRRNRRRFTAAPRRGAAQVVGADTDSGVKSVAFVITKSGVGFDEAALIEHCATRIAPIRESSVTHCAAHRVPNDFRCKRHQDPKDQTARTCALTSRQIVQGGCATQYRQLAVGIRRKVKLILDANGSASDTP